MPLLSPSKMRGLRCAQKTRNKTKTNCNSIVTLPPRKTIFCRRQPKKEQPTPCRTRTETYFTKFPQINANVPSKSNRLSSRFSLRALTTLHTSPLVCLFVYVIEHRKHQRGLNNTSTHTRPACKRTLVVNASAICTRS